MNHLYYVEDSILVNEKFPEKYEVRSPMGKFVKSYKNRKSAENYCTKLNEWRIKQNYQGIEI